MPPILFGRFMLGVPGGCLTAPRPARSVVLQSACFRSWCQCTQRKYTQLAACCLSDWVYYQVAPKELRGTLGSLMQLAIVTGILLATVVAVPIQTGDSGWRIALGVHTARQQHGITEHIGCSCAQCLALSCWWASLDSLSRLAGSVSLSPLMLPVPHCADYAAPMTCPLRCFTTTAATDTTLHCSLPHRHYPRLP